MPTGSHAVTSAVVYIEVGDAKWLTFSSRHFSWNYEFFKLINLLIKVPFFIANMNSMINLDKENEC